MKKSSEMSLKDQADKHTEHAVVANRAGDDEKVRYHQAQVAKIKNKLLKLNTVTSENKAEHDEKFMKARAGKSESPSNSGELADQAYALSAQKFPSGDAMKAHAVAAESYLKEKQHELATRHRELSHSHFLGLAKQDQSDNGEFHVYHKETNKHQGTYKSNKEASSFKNKLNENKPGEYHIITTPKND
jgi:hypothetical protein